MQGVRAAFAIVACYTSVAGCASRGQVGQVQEAGEGTYSIGVGSSHGLGASSQENKATDAAIDKAGQYCHAKREKLLVTSAIGNVINFRCTADGPGGQN